MIMKRDNLNKRNPRYETQTEEFHDYELGPETDKTQPTIFVDKSQHTTNYTTIINVTGEQVGQFDTRPFPSMKKFILESEISKKLVGVLDEIEEFLDDPLVFEQKLSKYLCLLEELYERRAERETYFSDLLLMLRMSLVNIESHELTKPGISVLKDAVRALALKINEEKLRELRTRLRNSNIDIMKPFKTNIDVKNILKEIYND